MARSTDQIAAALETGTPPPPGVLGLVPDVGFEIPEFNDDGPVNDVYLRHPAISDTDRAEWEMSMLRKYTHDRDVATDQAAQWHARIDSWLDAESRESSFWVEYFTARLMEWAIAQRLGSDDKVKTIKLPSGSIPTRASAESPIARVGIADPAALLAWAEAEELDIIKVEKKVLVTDLRAVVTVVDRAVFRGGEMLFDAEIRNGAHPDTGELILEAWAPGHDGEMEQLTGVSIVDGPFVIHRDGILVPGVEVADVVISATPKPAL